MKFLYALCGSMSAAEPLFETQRLFALTPKNKPNYRIPSIIQAPNGDILVICERRNDEITILDDGNNVCTDLTVGLDREAKKMWLFFLKDKKHFAHLTSSDNGLNWQGPVIIHDQVIKPEWQTLKGKVQEPAGNPKSHAVQWEKGWVQRYGCGPRNAMVQLKSGRLLVPARHREDVGKGRLRSFAHCFYSDDHGISWKLSGTIGINTSECQFVELNDGSVRVISRNESSEDSPDNLRHLTAVSKDGGVTWENLHRLEELITPRCHGCVERFDSKTLLFSSPASPIRQKEHPYGRYNLTVRLSIDDGETWSAGKTIWPHPGSYSDIVVLEDNTIGYIYERADKGSTHYWDELHFARFNLEWLE
jgi:sialidase-1